jgi:hypothetical protein
MKKHGGKKMAAFIQPGASSMPTGLGGTRAKADIGRPRVNPL